MTTPPAWPLVSVIVPVHNGARFLADALASIHAQAYAPLEVIVVDDGSTDETPTLLAGLGDAGRVVRQARQGPAAARNHGLRLARGEMVAFLDADDTWPPGTLRRLVGYLVEHPGTDIAQGLIQQLRLDLTAPGLVFEETSEPYQFINLGSAVYRRAVFERVGPFDAALWENEDTDWFFRAWEAGVTKAVLPEVALFYRKHDDNLSRAHTDPQRGLVRLFKRHLDRVRAGATAPSTPRPPIGAYIGTVPPPAPRVADTDFTVIANDCWGSGPYNHLGLMYRTPFVGTRVLAPCFLALLREPRRYVGAPLTFIPTSRYDFINERRAASLGDYPIALVRDRIEVHFVHERDPDVAAAKWARRSAKVVWDNLYIKFSQDPECCTDDMLRAFDGLDYPYKVAFTQREHPDLPSTVALPEYFVDGAPMYYLSRRVFDTVAWLNKTRGSDTQAYRVARPL